MIVIVLGKCTLWYTKMVRVAGLHLGIPGQSQGSQYWVYGGTMGLGHIFCEYFCFPQ